MDLTKAGLQAGMNSIAAQNQQAAGSLGSQAGFQQKQQATGQFLASGGQPIGKVQQQQAATQQAAKMGQANLAAAQSTVQQQQQTGQVALQAQQLENQKKLGEKRIGLQKKQRELDSALSSLGESVKNTLFTENMTFRQDEMGYTRFTERQLMDWKIMKAKNAQDLQKYQQQVMQASQRKTQLLKTAHAKIEQEIKERAQNKMMAQDQASQERLLRAKLELESQLNDQANASKNRAAMISTIMKAPGMLPYAAAPLAAAGVLKAAGAGDNPINNTINNLAGGSIGGLT